MTKTITVTNYFGGCPESEAFRLLLGHDTRMFLRKVANLRVCPETSF